MSDHQQGLSARTNASRAISIQDLFTIGIGPSSSHTVGPMRAAYAFVQNLLPADALVDRVCCDLYGSLALTGRGHATDRAVLLGLSGWQPHTVAPEMVNLLAEQIATSGSMQLGGRSPLNFSVARDLRFNREFDSGHPNTLLFTATLHDGRVIAQRYYSIGGGAIVAEGEASQSKSVIKPFPFSSGAELIALTRAHGMSIADVVRANETAWRPAAATDAFIDAIRAAMLACIDAGCATGGILPGGLKVPRRAHALHTSLLAKAPNTNPSLIFEWVSLWALAVNEENAAGGRVVTSPTNGAAGVIPAVLKYYETFVTGAAPTGMRDYFYTAAAIGFLYKKRASISAAEMGCQGEIGVACSMAAAGLVAALGGSPGQIENAAEIGMEHSLGLTCDPIGGLVQIPCIERNTMGAIKAINAAYLALQGDGSHIVSLDAVIETMRQTGLDMKSKYKETSEGGLAVNVVAC